MGDELGRDEWASKTLSVSHGGNCAAVTMYKRRKYN
jgi:hypothetical protein